MNIKPQTMKRKILLTSTILFFSFIAFAMIIGVTGKWTGQLTVPGGETKTIYYTFAVDNGKLTGSTEGTNEYDISEGKITGDSLSFAVVVANGDQILNSGKYYSDGDSISLNIYFMGAQMHTTLKRDTQQ
jgi:hypothetical protein